MITSGEVPRNRYKPISRGVIDVCGANDIDFLRWSHFRRTDSDNGCDDLGIHRGRGVQFMADRQDAVVKPGGSILSPVFWSLGVVDF